MNLPNAIFVGVEKSGSTLIHNILKEHDDIFAIKKETEFFSFYKIKKPRSYYVNDLQEYKNLFNNAGNKKIRLDVSTTYICCPRAIKNIKKLCPNIKIIVCLRNPVDRAYSRYWMSAKSNHELVDYSAEKFINFFFSHRTDIPWSNVRTRGMYFKNVRDLKEYFGDDNVLVLFYDELKKDGNKFFGKIINFLGIKKMSILKKRVSADSLYSKNKIIHKIFNSYINNIPNNYFFNILKKIYRFLRSFILKKYPPIGLYEKKKILEFYIKDIIKLERYLKVDLNKWKN